LSAQASDIRKAAVTAAAASAAIIAYQVAAKATRDALFLSSHDFSQLPIMMIGSAVVSILLAGLTSRVMARLGPARVMPIGFLVSAALLLVEWALSGPYRKFAAVAVYLHYAAFGGLLISGFWSFLNERFEPRAAKRELGRITAAGTIGGLFGGILSERVGGWFSVTAMLPILAAIHVVCALLMWRLRPLADDPIAAAREAAARESVARGETSSPIALLRGTPYIQSLVLLVLLVTISEALIDFVFKARAATMFGKGEELLRLFAAFYTGVSLLTVVVQTLFSRLALARLGLAGTVATVPAAVAAGSTAALALPGFPSAAILRGAESVLGNSIYRASYELLFTPIAARDKRSVKTLVDVGAARIGDVLGAGLVQAALVAFAVGTDRVILFAALALSLLAFPVAMALHAGYRRTLEKSLLTRAVQLDLDGVADSTTRSMILQTSGALALSQFLTLAGAESRPAIPESAPAAVEDAETRRVRALSSRDPGAVVHALREAPLTPSLVPIVVPLLAWDEVARDVVGALRRMGPDATEELVARLVDPDCDFSIRRRVPLVLATFRDQRAADGLFRGLSDRRFEVRYRSGRALSHLRDLAPTIAIDAREVFAAALREVAVDRRVWEGQRLLDNMDDAGWSPVVDEVIRDRANRSLEHVFTILSLALPRRPLQIAFRGLHTGDPLLRGTALEYLETSLPPDIRKQLWPFLEDTRPKRGPTRDQKAALDRLLESSESIAINLEELRRGRGTSPDA
jgi:HEAT repeat protein